MMYKLDKTAKKRFRRSPDFAIRSGNNQVPKSRKRLANNKSPKYHKKPLLYYGPREGVIYIKHGDDNKQVEQQVENGGKAGDSAVVEKDFLYHKIDEGEDIVDRGNKEQVVEDESLKDPNTETEEISKTIKADASDAREVILFKIKGSNQNPNSKFTIGIDSGITVDKESGDERSKADPDYIDDDYVIDKGDEVIDEEPGDTDRTIVIEFKHKNKNDKTDKANSESQNSSKEIKTIQDDKDSIGNKTMITEDDDVPKGSPDKVKSNNPESVNEPEEISAKPVESIHVNIKNKPGVVQVNISKDQGTGGDGKQLTNNGQKNKETEINTSTEEEKKDVVVKDEEEQGKGENINAPTEVIYEDVDRDQYLEDCPTVCPARHVMLCARCKEGVYRTFMSVCHLRMFNCKHPEEKLELVSRKPCILSAPFFNDMKTRGTVREPDDEDRILRFIRCRENGDSNDPRCAFGKRRRGRRIVNT
ncbi:myb-like protein X [Battus philenor]|uniref:myb-like protein X n=1 Tax=Battus philenor TaxID=42288 RepID=UPI0035CED529